MTNRASACGSGWSAVASSAPLPGPVGAPTAPGTGPPARGAGVAFGSARGRPPSHHSRSAALPSWQASWLTRSSASASVSPGASGASHAVTAARAEPEPVAQPGEGGPVDQRHRRRVLTQGALEQQPVGVRAPVVVHRHAGEVAVDAGDGQALPVDRGRVADADARRLCPPVAQPQAGGARLAVDALDVVEGAVAADDRHAGGVGRVAADQLDRVDERPPGGRAEAVEGGQRVGGIIGQQLRGWRRAGRSPPCRAGSARSAARPPTRCRPTTRTAARPRRARPGARAAPATVATMPGRRRSRPGARRHGADATVASALRNRELTAAQSTRRHAAGVTSRRASNVSTVSATHTSTNPASRSAGSDSSSTSTPQSSCPVGVRYCSRPSVESGMRRAAVPNSTSGVAVTTPRLSSRRSRPTEPWRKAASPRPSSTRSPTRATGEAGGLDRQRGGGRNRHLLLDEPVAGERAGQHQRDPRHPAVADGEHGDRRRRRRPAPPPAAAACVRRARRRRGPR